MSTSPSPTLSSPTGSSITRDPVYYITAAFFALLTTAVPALMGQPRFMPAVQTLGLTVLMVVALHHHNPGGALRIMALWLPVQFIVLVLLTRLFGAQVEHAFTDGFAYRGAITAWFFGGGPLPGSLAVEPIRRVVELAAVSIGSVVSAGLVGVWVTVSQTNRAAYGMGVLLRSLVNGGDAFFTVPLWSLVRIAGYAGLVVLLAEPLLTYTWSPSVYWRTRRRLILVAVTLIVAGLLLELLLPGYFARTPVA